MGFAGTSPPRRYDHSWLDSRMEVRGAPPTLECPWLQGAAGIRAMAPLHSRSQPPVLCHTHTALFQLLPDCVSLAPLHKPWEVNINPVLRRFFSENGEAIWPRTCTREGQDIGQVLGLPRFPLTNRHSCVNLTGEGCSEPRSTRCLLNQVLLTGHTPFQELCTSVHRDHLIMSQLRNTPLPGKSRVNILGFVELYWFKENGLSIFDCCYQTG